MDLHAALASLLLREHPREAARALEGVAVADAAAALESVEPESAAEVLSQVSPASSAEILERLDSQVLTDAVSRLTPDRAARLVRRLPVARRDALYTSLPSRSATPLRALLRHPENTAGSLMDPDVMALPSDLTAKEAVDRIRENPKNARYNLYITDPDGRLVGVVNLREILLATPKSSLDSFMHTEVQRLRAGADRSQIVAHPGWRRVHALPVVDDDEQYLGAIRFGTLRRIEGDLSGAHHDENTTARALGDLFSTAGGGLLEALIGAGEPTRRNGDGT